MAYKLILRKMQNLVKIAFPFLINFLHSAGTSPFLFRYLLVDIPSASGKSVTSHLLDPPNLYNHCISTCQLPHFPQSFRSAGCGSLLQDPRQILDSLCPGTGNTRTDFLFLTSRLMSPFYSLSCIGGQFSCILSLPNSYQSFFE